MLVDVYRLTSPNICPSLCYKLMGLQGLNALTQLIVTSDYTCVIHRQGGFTDLSGNAVTVK